MAALKQKIAFRALLCIILKVIIKEHGGFTKHCMAPKIIGDQPPD